jgi:abortive infection bacteriophage resistance protein
MTVGDRAAALAYLERVGYYRLSAYWYPFRRWELRQDATSGAISHIRTDTFLPDTHFRDAVALYLFDKQLRLITVDALERIEVALRVDIAYLLGKRNTFAHLDASALHPTFALRPEGAHGTAHAAWLDRYAKLVGQSKEDFVKHYHQTHGPDLPIWVAVELLDFGALSKLFAMMKVDDQQAIAQKYGIVEWQVFKSWLRSLSYLRNLCAHHSRLWNRNVVARPKLPSASHPGWWQAFSGTPDLQTKPFLLLAICRHVVQRVCPNTQWHARLKDHLATFPTLRANTRRGLDDMGTPGDWRDWW